MEGQRKRNTYASPHNLMIVTTIFSRGFLAAGVLSLYLHHLSRKYSFLSCGLLVFIFSVIIGWDRPYNLPDLFSAVVAPFSFDFTTRNQIALSDTRTTPALTYLVYSHHLYDPGSIETAITSSSSHIVGHFSRLRPHES